MLCCTSRPIDLECPASSQECSMRLWLFVLLVMVPSLKAQVCTPDWLPGEGIPGVAGTVRASVEWDPDGPGPAPARLVIGGSFSIVGTATASNVAQWDGT